MNNQHIDYGFYDRNRVTRDKKDYAELKGFFDGLYKTGLYSGMVEDMQKNIESPEGLVSFMKEFNKNKQVQVSPQDVFRDLEVSKENLRKSDKSILEL